MKARQLILWIALGAIGILLIVWAFPRAYVFFPQHWTTSRAEAVAIALERTRDLGEPIADPLVMAALPGDEGLVRRFQLAAEEVATEVLQESWLAKRIVRWRVSLYAPGATDTDWTYRVELGLDGTLTGLLLRVPPEEEAASIDPAEARMQADAFLSGLGFELAEYGEPEVKTVDRAARTDLSLRYTDREEVFGEALPYGVEVMFAGDRLAGFATWYEDPEQREILRSLQNLFLMNQGWLLAPLPLCLIVAIVFLRRYHAGEIGVTRGVQIFLVVMGLNVLFLSLSLGSAADAWATSVFSRQIMNWIAFIQLVLIFLFPASLLAALSWSVGESICRERWSEKLAAFDALFQGEWDNATVGRATLRGAAAGLLVLGSLLAISVPLRRLGVSLLPTSLLEPWWAAARFPGVALLGFVLAFGIYREVFGRLLLLPWAVKRLGKWGGGLLVVLVTGLILWPPIIALPVSWSLPFWFAVAAALVVLFLRFDLLTAVMASLTISVLPSAFPFVTADDRALQFQGSLALLGVAMPLILSLRYLGSDREFVYRYEDVPPHVRRIAERERQKVELETARRIQASILPALPARLNGVDLAYTYLPATEVGGDFYDVLALEDGRLAVAVGDVAGHGVSSGLVMSMAKSALAVQVAFDPEVESVFATLNRMVFQSARKRLLATLCYAVVDPSRREISYASAGHLFPYRVSRRGEVEALESVSYPLGVRDHLEIRVRSRHLEAGDLLFLFSDGVVEARPEGSDDLFGFDRLEESLARHAAEGVGGLRDGVMADLQTFTGAGPREDDLTLLVLRVP